MSVGLPQCVRHDRHLGIHAGVGRKAGRIRHEETRGAEARAVFVTHPAVRGVRHHRAAEQMHRVEIAQPRRCQVGVGERREVGFVAQLRRRLDRQVHLDGVCGEIGARRGEHAVAKPSPVLPAGVVGDLRGSIATQADSTPRSVAKQHGDAGQMRERSHARFQLGAEAGQGAGRGDGMDGDVLEHEARARVAVHIAPFRHRVGHGGSVVRVDGLAKARRHVHRGVHLEIEADAAAEAAAQQQRGGFEHPGRDTDDRRVDAQCRPGLAAAGVEPGRVHAAHRACAQIDPVHARVCNDTTAASFGPGHVGEQRGLLGAGRTAEIAVPEICTVPHVARHRLRGPAEAPGPEFEPMRVPVQVRARRRRGVNVVPDAIDERSEGRLVESPQSVLVAPPGEHLARGAPAQAIVHDRRAPDTGTRMKRDTTVGGGCAVQTR
jgi:hypothetical protein